MSWPPSPNWPERSRDPSPSSSRRRSSTGLADDDPALSQSLRTALVDDEVLSQPSEQLDPSSAVAIGEEQTFTRRLGDGEDLIAEALPGVAGTRSAWLTTSPVSTDAAIMLRDLGFDLLALDMDTYGQLDGNIGGFVDTTLASRSTSETTVPCRPS